MKCREEEFRIYIWTHLKQEQRNKIWTMVKCLLRFMVEKKKLLRNEIFDVNSK